MAPAIKALFLILLDLFHPALSSISTYPPEKKVKTTHESQLVNIYNEKENFAPNSFSVDASFDAEDYECDKISYISSSEDEDLAHKCEGEKEESASEESLFKELADEDTKADDSYVKGIADSSTLELKKFEQLDPNFDPKFNYELSKPPLHSEIKRLLMVTELVSKQVMEQTPNFKIEIEMAKSSFQKGFSLAYCILKMIKHQKTVFVNFKNKVVTIAQDARQIEKQRSNIERMYISEKIKACHRNLNKTKLSLPLAVSQMQQMIEMNHAYRWFISDYRKITTEFDQKKRSVPFFITRLGLPEQQQIQELLPKVQLSLIEMHEYHQRNSSNILSLFFKSWNQMDFIQETFKIQNGMLLSLRKNFLQFTDQLDCLGYIYNVCKAIKCFDDGEQEVIYPLQSESLIDIIGVLQHLTSEQIKSFSEQIEEQDELFTLNFLNLVRKNMHQDLTLPEVFANVIDNYKDELYQGTFDACSLRDLIDDDIESLDTQYTSWFKRYDNI